MNTSKIKTEPLDYDTLAMQREVQPVPLKIKQKVQKKIKIPGQPRRPHSPFLIWKNANRDQIRADNPGVGKRQKSIAKISGEIWTALADKSEWEQKAAEDKKRYEIEYQTWRNDGGGEAIRAHKKAYKNWLKGDTTEDNFARPEPEFEPMLIKPEPIGGDFKPKIELKKEDCIAFERGIEETLNLDIKPDPDALDMKRKVKIKQEIFIGAENRVKKEDTNFQPTKPEPISDDFEAKIDFKKEKIAFERGMEETLNLDIKVDLALISDDFKPKIELKKEDTISFERGIEETLNLEIRADPGSTGKIQSKIKKKDSRFTRCENDLLMNKAVKTAVDVLSNENDKRSKRKVQEIKSTKNFRIPKLSDKVQEKSPKIGSIHDGKKRFKCAMCSERFSQRNDLNQRFHCDKCSVEEKKRLSKFKKSNGGEGLTKAELKGFQGLTKAELIKELMDKTKEKEKVLKKKEGKGKEIFRPSKV